MNPWIERHLTKHPSDEGLAITANRDQSQLEWEGLIAESEPWAQMPVLRANYMDLQADYMAYLTEASKAATEDRMRHWARKSGFTDEIMRMIENW